MDSTVQKKATFEFLPKNVVPLNYNIEIDPCWTEPTFRGEEIITIRVNDETRQIKLHTADTTINEVSFKKDPGITKNVKFQVDEQNQFLIIDFEEPLESGTTGKILIKFEGVIHDDLKGFFRSKPTNPGLENSTAYPYTYATHFESCFCRRAFPCWDEPEFKATFDVSLVVPRTRTGLSNMPLISETPHPSNNGLKIMKFSQSPVMSTYLVGFAIGEFDFVECTTPEGILCRVYTPPGKKEQGEFGLDVASKAVSFFSNYFGIQYPLPKLDLVPVAELACGAMENWGMVTFRETLLLVDKEGTSTVNKQYIALVIAHEISHTWFGNLVTMKWWTDLWLKEGFASFMEYVCVDNIFPEYHIWMQFATDSLIEALQLDALKFSHPIEVPVGDPNEVDEIFDSISYCKGASIIRMLSRYIGDATFRKGIELYLKRHQYSNATTEDLWKALEEVSEKPVGKVMSTWTNQKGFPLVTVEFKKDSKNIVLTQRKFSHVDAAIDVPEESDSIYKWFIPCEVNTTNGTCDSGNELLLMDTEMSEVHLTGDGFDGNKHIKVNPGIIGYYRVKYSPEALDQFTSSIRDLSLPAMDRLGLLDDAFAIVGAGHASSVSVLKLLSTYEFEENFAVWSAVINILDKFKRLLIQTDLVNSFNAYGQRILNNIVTKLGWEKKTGEEYLDTLLRPLVLRTMVGFGHEATISTGKRFFELFLTGGQLIPPDLSPAIYRAAVIDATEKTYNNMLEIYRNSELLAEKVRILLALSTLKCPILLGKLLNFSITDEVKPEDTLRVLEAMSTTKAGQNIVWNFFKENCAYFQTRIPSGHHILHFVKGFTDNFSTLEKAEEVEQFFKENVFRGADRSVQQGVENIRINQSWLERDLTAIQTFLTQA